MGQTPVEVGHLFPGPYRIQVECEPGRTGRVHTAEVNDGPSEVFVDLRFDGVVQTRPILGLHYANASGRRTVPRDRDAAQIAQAVPADCIVLMSMSDAGVMELDLLTGTTAREERIGTSPEWAKWPDAR